MPRPRWCSATPAPARCAQAVRARRGQSATRVANRSNNVAALGAMAQLRFNQGQYLDARGIHAAPPRRGAGGSRRAAAGGADRGPDGRCGRRRTLSPVDSTNPVAAWEWRLERSTQPVSDNGDIGIPEAAAGCGRRLRETRSHGHEPGRGRRTPEDAGARGRIAGARGLVAAGAPVFVRGQLRSYSRLLGLTTEPIVAASGVAPVAPAELQPRTYTPAHAAFRRTGLAPLRLCRAHRRDRGPGGWPRARTSRRSPRRPRRWTCPCRSPRIRTPKRRSRWWLRWRPCRRRSRLRPGWC